MAFAVGVFAAMTKWGELKPGDVLRFREIFIENYYVVLRLSETNEKRMSVRIRILCLNDGRDLTWQFAGSEPIGNNWSLVVRNEPLSS